MAVYGETPRALIKRLLDPDTDLLAFSNIFFAPTMTTLLELFNNLNTDDVDARELAIRAVKEARQSSYNTVRDSFKLTSPKLSMVWEKVLQ